MVLKTDLAISWGLSSSKGIERLTSWITTSFMSKPTHDAEVFVCVCVHITLFENIYPICDLLTNQYVEHDHAPQYTCHFNIILFKLRALLCHKNTFFIWGCLIYVSERFYEPPFGPVMATLLMRLGLARWCSGLRSARSSPLLGSARLGSAAYLAWLQQLVSSCDTRMHAACGPLVENNPWETELR